MKILFACLIPVFFFAVIGGITFVMLKKMNVIGGERAKETNASTLQQFIPLSDIEGGYLKMKDGSLAAVIECSSTHYNHLSAEEQDAMEMIYQSYINSLNFPIVTYIQSRVIDNTRRCKYLRDNIDEVENIFPNLSEYAEQYYAAMENINYYVGNSRQKKKFVIVPYNEQIGVADLTEDEKETYITKEIQRRCDTIISGLSSLQIKAVLLNENGLKDFVYATFNRDGYSYAENITTDEALSLFVDGEKSGLNGASQKTKIARDLEKIINEVQTFGEDFGVEKENLVESLKEVESRYF